MCLRELEQCRIDEFQGSDEENCRCGTPCHEQMKTSFPAFVTSPLSTIADSDFDILRHAHRWFPTSLMDSTGC
jgi:hypothetical protein